MARGQKRVKIYPATLQQSAPAPTILTHAIDLVVVAVFQPIEGQS